MNKSVINKMQWIPVIGLYFANPKNVNRRLYEPYQFTMAAIALYYIWFV